MPVNKQAVRAIELAINIVRSYPDYPTTLSDCQVCHSNPPRAARGGMPCPYCLEDELAELVGGPLARYFHRRIKRLIKEIDE
jgi:hypothetical protein